MYSLLRCKADNVGIAYVQDGYNRVPVTAFLQGSTLSFASCFC